MADPEIKRVRHGQYLVPLFIRDCVMGELEAKACCFCLIEAEVFLQVVCDSPHALGNVEGL